jgi:hypothetical protein
VRNLRIIGDALACHNGEKTRVPKPTERSAQLAHADAATRGGESLRPPRSPIPSAPVLAVRISPPFPRFLGDTLACISEAPNHLCYVLMFPGPLARWSPLPVAIAGHA